MRYSSLVVALASLVAGCGATRKSVAVPPERFGIYRFTQPLNPGYTLEGEFLVEGDTVTVDATPGPCRYEPNRTNGMTIVYSCGGSITLSFDRADPIGRARYSAVVRIRTSRNRCVRSAIVNGQAVCQQTVLEVSERDTTKTGTLRTERAEPAVGTYLPPSTSPLRRRAATNQASM